ncbi:MAG TPA: arsenate reductase (glutaredoxin) [Steroidobacteraceae bacterium]|nr:arsenate reductase (glutaredoxin) [Steroidobacteraceae bacterium]
MSAEDAEVDATSVTIYHNPACSTSRNTLALIRNSGIEPTIIEYLQEPPSRETLTRLLHAMGISPRGLMRTKEALYAELKLGDEHWSDAELIDFMLAHPILMNRPIVVTALGTALCRPTERVLELLPDSRRQPA